MPNEHDNNSKTAIENRLDSQPLDSEINVHETKALIDGGTSMVLIDCREPQEHSHCHIEGAVLIPMDDVPDRVSELEKFRKQRMVVYCHHGGRSLCVVNWLRNHGFETAQNMTGGIDIWSQEIDPEVPRY